MKSKRNRSESRSRPSLGDYLVFLQLLVGIVAKGWAHLLVTLSKIVVVKATELRRNQVIFLASSLATLFVAAPPWLSYQISFVENETVQIGANYKILYLLPGVLGIALAFFKIPAKRIVYYIAVLPTLALYLTGFIFPQPIFTNLIRLDDFSYLPTIYLYGPLLCSALITARNGLKESILSFDRLYQQPLERPSSIGPDSLESAH